METIMEQLNCLSAIPGSRRMQTKVDWDAPSAKERFDYMVFNRQSIVKDVSLVFSLNPANEHFMS